MHLSKFIRIASLLAGSIALSSLASASILITLDVARLESENIFTVTSTNGFPTVHTVGAVTSQQGLTLLDLFAKDVDIVKWDASVSNFQCSSAPYDDILSKAEIIDYDIFGDPNRANLNIWGQGPQGQNHAFDDLFYLSLWATNPTYAAFVGTFSTTSGLTTTSRGLSPAQAISPVGTIGSVRIGYGDFNGFDGYSYPTIIGEYQIINSAIPEPSVYAALAALAVLGFTVTRRFRS